MKLINGTSTKMIDLVMYDSDYTDDEAFRSVDCEKFTKDRLMVNMYPDSEIYKDAYYVDSFDALFKELTDWMTRSNGYEEDVENLFVLSERGYEVTDMSNDLKLAVDYEEGEATELIIPAHYDENGNYVEERKPETAKLCIYETDNNKGLFVEVNTEDYPYYNMADFKELLKDKMIEEAESVGINPKNLMFN